MSKSHVWCEVTMFHKSQKNIIITRFFHRFFMDKSLESHHTLKKKWINGNGSKFHTSTTDWNVYLSMMVSSDLTHTQMAVSWVIGATPSHHMSSIFVGIFHEKNHPAIGDPPWLWKPQIRISLQKQNPSHLLKPLQAKSFGLLAVVFAMKNGGT